MFCQKCGAQNVDDAVSCCGCGVALPRAAAPVQIPNYLLQSILVTVLCCLPFGIPAIVFASQVNTKIQAGDIAGAMESSRKAKMWSWISFSIGFAVSLIYVVLMALGMVAGAA